MCVVDFDEQCELWKETTHKARKLHRCSMCGGPIKPGDLYRRHFSVYDGSCTNEKCCPACIKVEDKFVEEHNTKTSPGDMCSLITECSMSGEPTDRFWELCLHYMEERNKLWQTQSVT